MKSREQKSEVRNSTLNGARLCPANSTGGASWDKSFGNWRDQSQQRAYARRYGTGRPPPPSSLLRVVLSHTPALRANSEVRNLTNTRSNYDHHTTN